MQPLKIALPGQFWDSQIYRGKLYLFGRDGDLVVVNWDALLDDLGVGPEDALALRCAFKTSDLLYSPRLADVLSDPELLPIMRRKFARLSEIPLEIGRQAFERHIFKRQRNPFPFPHSDCTIYYNKMYVGGPSGVWSATCAKVSGNPVSSRPTKSWDAPVFAVAALYRALACAAGDDGLFELDLQGIETEPAAVSTRNCVDCHWTFESIYGSSHLAPGFLAEYAKVSEDDYTFERKFERIVDESDIFHDTGYSWGTQDKLCQASEGKVRVVRYGPSSSAVPERLQQVQTITLDAWKGDVVSGKLAVFGAIVECDAAIVVALSDETVITLPGEPVNWRVFPKSIRYENHLHIVYDDYLLIASFNQDYFVDQSQKRLGIKYYPEFRGWSRSYQLSERRREERPSVTDISLDKAIDSDEPF